MSTVKLTEMIINTEEVREKDILLGKGRACKSCVGTMAFKSLVDTRLWAYTNPVCSSRQKTQLTMEVLGTVWDGGGRFLLQDKKNSDVWYVLNKAAARPKIRDTFRDCIKNLQRMGRSSVLLNTVGLSQKFTVNDTYASIFDSIVNNPHVQLFLCQRSSENIIPSLPVVQTAPLTNTRLLRQPRTNIKPTSSQETRDDIMSWIGEDNREDASSDDDDNNSSTTLDVFAELKNNNCLAAGGVIVKHNVPQEEDEEKRKHRAMTKRRSAKKRREHHKQHLSQLSKDVQDLTSEKRALAETNSKLMAELRRMRKRQKLSDDYAKKIAFVHGFEEGRKSVVCNQHTIASPSKTSQEQSLGLPSLLMNNGGGRYLDTSRDPRRDPQGFHLLNSLTTRVQALTNEHKVLVDAHSHFSSGMQDINQRLSSVLAAANRQYFPEKPGV